MTGRVTRCGYRYSVYHRIARAALHEKRVSYDVVDVDPFSHLDASYPGLHPFGRVPTLLHGEFSVYETSAISRYIDCAFEGPLLSPAEPKAKARVDQVISVIDNYGYWPMVRQVFAHRVFNPLAGGHRR